MEWRTVAEELGLGDAPLPEWERSQASLPAGELFFLAPQFITHACREAAIPAPVCEAAVAAGGRIAGSPAARALVWHFHHALFRTASDGPTISDWPSLEAAPRGDGRMLYLLVLLSGLPEVEAEHRKRGIPVETTRETLSDIPRWLGGVEDGPMDPPWGITPRAISWLLHHLRGDLYRLGRLQFEFSPFDHPVRVFRHRDSGAVVALAEEGVEFRADGGRVTEGVETGPGAWTAHLELGASCVIGNPILPEGRAVPRRAVLPRGEWEQVLAVDDPALSLHIPVSGPLGFEECAESLRRALVFFPKHFPDRPFRAFCCTSWLLDAELQDLLPDTSNLVRFQREFYLLPVCLTPEDVLQNVVGPVPSYLTPAARTTSLQRAVRAALDGGGTLRPTGGGCFLLPEDFAWGSQRYLRQPPLP